MNEAERKRSGFESEPWLERLVDAPDQAVLNAGRLVNCFRFHAVQAWLLLAPGQEEKARSEFRFACRSLDKLVTYAYDVGVSDSDELRNAIVSKRDFWTEKFNIEKNWCSSAEAAEADWDEDCIENAWHARCRQIAIRVVDRFQEPIRKLFLDRLDGKEWTVFLVGERLDQGIRSPYVFRHLLPNQKEKEEEQKRLEEELSDLTDWDVNCERPRLNNLARYSRGPGEVLPADAWREEVLIVIQKAGLDVELPDQLASRLDEIAIVNIVSDLDHKIRQALNTGPVMPSVGPDRFEVALGKHRCEFGDTDEFKFIQLLVESLNQPVGYTDIEDKLGRIKERASIRKLKQRVVERLEDTGRRLKSSQMIDFAQAIHGGNEKYTLRWPPTHN